MHQAHKLHALTPPHPCTQMHSFTGSFLNEGSVAETEQFNLFFPSNPGNQVSRFLDL